MLPPLTLLAGCANPGPPHPPSLHLPALATGLTADRIGTDVRLSWNTPDKTSDGLTNSAPMTAVLCRTPAPVLRHSGAPTACNPVLRLTVQPGQSHVTDTLPAALQQDPPYLLAYQVELLNSKGRSAGVSAPVLAAAGAAPPLPGPLSVNGSRKGTLIEWPAQGATTPSVVRITRTPASAATDLPAPAGTKHAVALPTATRRDSAASIMLQSPAGPDPGGMLDSGALPDVLYTYVAQRVRTVTLGNSTFELRSGQSQPIKFAYREVFPPDPPSGLQSIPSVPLASRASIDLSWDASSDNGVAGYNVYRHDASSTAFERLNPTPISGVSFRDLTAQPGHTYLYRVTAVDPAGNESAPSQEITETLKMP